MRQRPLRVWNIKARPTLGSSVIVCSGPLFLVISHEIEQGLLMQRDTSEQDVSGKQIPPSNLQGWTLHPPLMVTGLKITTGADSDFLFRFFCHFVFRSFLLSYYNIFITWYVYSLAPLAVPPSSSWKHHALILIECQRFFPRRPILSLCSVVVMAVVSHSFVPSSRWRVLLKNQISRRFLAE